MPGPKAVAVGLSLFGKPEEDHTDPNEHVVLLWVQGDI